MVARGKKGWGGLRRHPGQGQRPAQIPVLPVDQISGHHDQIRGRRRQGRPQRPLQIRTVYVGDLGDFQTVQPLQPCGEGDLIPGDGQLPLHRPGPAPRRRGPGGQQKGGTLPGVFPSTSHFNHPPGGTAALPPRSPVLW